MDKPRPRPHDDEHDDALARLLEPLEPAAATVARVVHRALENPGLERASTPLWRPWLVAVAATVVLALLGTLPLWHTAERETHPTSILTITNHDGPVAVLTPAGTQLVVIPGGSNATP